jgi:hypothetical protein
MQVLNHRGAMIGSALPLQLSEELRELSRREGVTLYMTLLAAFKLCCTFIRDHRHSGWFADSQSQPGQIEGLIGFS